jgi:hypothetical protein
VSDGWQIYRDADERWRWKYIMQGRAVAQARRGHEQYSACIAEARVHGYREHVTAGDRRPTNARGLRAKRKTR